MGRIFIFEKNNVLIEFSAFLVSYDGLVAPRDEGRGGGTVLCPSTPSFSLHFSPFQTRPSPSSSFFLLFFLESTDDQTLLSRFDRFFC